MASETLAANTTPIVDNASTGFPAGALTHTSRILSATAVGELEGTSHVYRDKAYAYYSTDSGVTWTLWKSWSVSDGIVAYAETLPNIAISVLVPMSQILVRLNTFYQHPDHTFQLESIQIVGDSTSLPATKVYAHCDLFGF